MNGIFLYVPYDGLVAVLVIMIVVPTLIIGFFILFLVKYIIKRSRKNKD